MEKKLADTNSHQNQGYANEALVRPIREKCWPSLLSEACNTPQDGKVWLVTSVKSMLALLCSNHECLPDSETLNPVEGELHVRNHMSLSMLCRNLMWLCAQPSDMTVLLHVCLCTA